MTGGNGPDAPAARTAKPLPNRSISGRSNNWVGFNLRMAQEAAFQAFSRRSQEIGESPGRFATLTLIGAQPRHQPDRAEPRQRPRQVEPAPRWSKIWCSADWWSASGMRSDRRTYRLNLTPAGKRR